MPGGLKSSHWRIPFCLMSTRPRWWCLARYDEAIVTRQCLSRRNRVTYRPWDLPSIPYPRYLLVIRSTSLRDVALVRPYSARRCVVEPSTNVRRIGNIPAILIAPTIALVRAGRVRAMGPPSSLQPVSRALHNTPAPLAIHNEPHVLAVEQLAYPRSTPEGVNATAPPSLAWRLC